MKFLDFFKEDSPYSSMRLAAVGMTLLFAPAFVVIWTWVSFVTRTIADIPSGVMWLLGVLLGVKTLQKGVEIAGQWLKPKDPPEAPNGG